MNLLDVCGRWRVLLATTSYRMKTMRQEAEIASAIDFVDPERTIHPDEARATIFQLPLALTTERVSLREASWRVLSADLVATEDQPHSQRRRWMDTPLSRTIRSPWRGNHRTAVGWLRRRTSEVSLKLRAPGSRPDRRCHRERPRWSRSRPLTGVADEHVPIVYQERVAAGKNIRPVGVDLARCNIRGVAARESPSAPRRRAFAELGSIRWALAALQSAFVDRETSSLEPDENPAPGRSATLTASA